MAHYIIDDRGFGGMFYKCSNCGTIFYDVIDEIDLFECPACRVAIDPDENEYDYIREV